MNLNHLKNYFHFTRTERNGVIVLTGISLVLVFLPVVYPLIVKKENPDFSVWEGEMKKWEMARQADSVPVTLFKFDPNKVEFEELKKLGLSDRVARTWINFRNKGGAFRKKEEVKRVYGMTEKDYKRLEGYIQIEKKYSHANTSKKNEYKKRKTFVKKDVEVIVDINTASEEEWQKLRGIGPYFAGRIVNFRDKLGGFTSIEQIAETYHLPDSTFLAIKPFLKISPISRKININTVSAEALKSHPYISWRQANAIVKYRKLHGPFEKVEDVDKLYVLSAEVKAKIKPYLVVE